MKIIFDESKDLEFINNYWNIHNETDAADEELEVKLAFLKSSITAHIESVNVENQRHILYTKYVSDFKAITDNGSTVISWSEV